MNILAKVALSGKINKSAYMQARKSTHELYFNIFWSNICKWTIFPLTLPPEITISMLRHVSILLAIFTLMMCVAPAIVHDRCMSSCCIEQECNGNCCDDEGCDCCSPFIACNTCTGFTTTTATTTVRSDNNEQRMIIPTTTGIMTAYIPVISPPPKHCWTMRWKRSAEPYPPSLWEMAGDNWTTIDFLNQEAVEKLSQGESVCMCVHVPNSHYLKPITDIQQWNI